MNTIHVATVHDVSTTQASELLFNTIITSLKLNGVELPQITPKKAKAVRATSGGPETETKAAKAVRATSGGMIG